MNIQKSQSGFGADIQQIIRDKNDFKHDRTPSDEETIRKKSADLAIVIDRCMKALAFFTDYPIRQIREMEYLPDKTYRYQCLRFLGDHPGLAQENVILPIPLPKGLYIDLGHNEWKILDPFIVTQNCPTCHTREIYFIDRWADNNSSVNLKSFERGHTVEDDHLKIALQGKMR